MNLAKLCLQLIGLEGWLVRAVDLGGEVREFVVGRTTDSRPYHVEIKPDFSSARDADHRGYHSVKLLWLMTKGNPLD